MYCSGLFGCMSQKQSRTSDDRHLPCWLIYLLTLFLTEQWCPWSEGSVWASYSPVLLGYGAHPCLFPAWVFPEGKLNEEWGVKSLFPPGEQLRDLSWNRPVTEFIPYPKCFINTGSLPMHCKNKQTTTRRRVGGRMKMGRWMEKTMQQPVQPMWEGQSECAVDKVSYSGWGQNGEGAGQQSQAWEGQLWKALQWIFSVLGRGSCQLCLCWGWILSYCKLQ